MQVKLLAKRSLAVLLMVMMLVMFLGVGTPAVHAQRLSARQSMVSAHPLVTSKTVFIAPQPRHLVIPLSPTSNCNLDGPSESGLFLCAVDSSVAPGCLIEHSTPNLGTGNRTGLCFSAGTVLGIICQTTGDLVNNTTRVWDFLVAGGYVTDFYMDTSGINGAFSPPIRRC